MVIPRVNLSCHYITSELEEIEREDNFRLKRFKELKIKKQKAKEVKMVKVIPEECAVCTQESDKTICTCISNIEIPKTDKVSTHSVYKDEETEIEHDRKPSKIKNEINVINQGNAQADSKTKSSDNKIKPSELIKLNQKDSKRSHKCYQPESQVNTPQSKQSKIICPNCDIQTKASSKEFSGSCTGTILGIYTSTNNDFSPTSQNQEANIKIVTSTYSYSQLADIELLSDEDIKIDKENKTKKEKKQRDESNPQRENKGNQNVVESVKEIKIRKYTDKDGNTRVEKRTVTTTFKKKLPVSKCCSESMIYKKPSYAGSNRTVKVSKLKGKCDQTSVNPCGSASTEVSKAQRSVAGCCDANKNDQEVHNKSTYSTRSASIASVDYSCSDKTISACNISSDSRVSEEVKTTQTCPFFSKQTQTENEKPKSSYCTIKIFAKTDSDVPSDESKNIELTPSTLDLLKKIILQASKSPASSDFLKRQLSQKCECSTKATRILKQKSICPTNKKLIPNELIEDEKPQVCSCQKKTKQEEKEETSNNERVQFMPSLETGSVEVTGREMKNISTETTTGSIEKSRPVVKKHSCGSKVNISKHSITKKENSVCSCKSKKSINNTELKCPCSKSQNAPPEQKTCTCSKVNSEESKCICNSKQETIKPWICSAPKLSCSGKASKPDLDLKCCIKNETADDIKSINSISSKICSKCASTNKAAKPEITDYPETKEVNTQKPSYDSCCSQKKPESDSKTVASKCSLCGKKDASTSTRRSDRYDVRPLRLLMLSKSAPSVCLSDAVIVKNKRCNNTRVRRCISYNEKQQSFRKSNVLAKIVIPRLNVTTQYINSELEEKEREEVFRLKRVKQKKDADRRIEETERREKYLQKKVLEKGGLPVVPEEKESVKEMKPPDK